MGCNNNSNNLPNTGNIEIGLYFFIDAASPDLGMGTTLVSFHAIGKIPDFINSLYMIESGKESLSGYSVANKLGIPSDLASLLRSRCFRPICTSF